jgi:hypothetical protein
MRHDFPTIHPTDILRLTQQERFHVFRVPLGLNIEKLRTTLHQIKTRHPWSQKDGLPWYEALGLQFSDPANPYQDSVAVETTYNYNHLTQTTACQEPYPEAKALRPFRFYDSYNEAGLAFKDVFNRLRPLQLFRSRLLMARPGFQMQSAHVDGIAAVRIHVPIETNPEAWFEVEDRHYHLPADGSAYVVNTSVLHRIGNPGTTDRTHLVSVLYPSYPHLLHPIAQMAFRRLVEIDFRGERATLVGQRNKALQRSDNSCEFCRKPFSAHNLYVLPTASGQLKVGCQPCIETFCRGIERSTGLGDKAVHEFKAQLESIR